MNSCIYEGRVRHRRHQPRRHFFSYSLFMLYLDLDELPNLFNGYWFWSVEKPSLARFCRQDHMGNPDISLKEEVLDVVERETGSRPRGGVRLLTNLKYFGYIFNPICLYYCFDEGDKTVEAIVAQVSNTPWNERYIYVFDVRQNSSKRKMYYTLDKKFHVSPFIGMDIRYEWRLTMPGDHLLLHINNWQENDKLFDATLLMKKRPVSHKNMSYMLIKYPFITGKIIVAIYLEALRLFLKKIPFYAHPAKLKTLESS